MIKADLFPFPVFAGTAPDIDWRQWPLPEISADFIQISSRNSETMCR
jgi:hypothetical protein